jgi:hypothetical protein
MAVLGVVSEAARVVSVDPRVGLEKDLVDQVLRVGLEKGSADTEVPRVDLVDTEVLRLDLVDTEVLRLDLVDTEVLRVDSGK